MSAPPTVPFLSAPPTVPFFNSTMLWPATLRAMASRSGVWVTALLLSSLTHVPGAILALACATHGTAASSSNSPVAMRAANRRVSETSTSFSV